MSEWSRGLGGNKLASSKAAKRLWRDYEEHLTENVEAVDVRIGVAASFTANTLVQFFGGYLVTEGFRPKFLVGPYNQLFQTCVDPTTAFGETCDIVVILWRLEDLMLEEVDAGAAGDEQAIARATEKIAWLVESIRHLRAVFSKTIIVGVPPFPTGVSTGLLAVDNALRLGSFHRIMVGKFIDGLRAIEGVALVDLDAVQRAVGLEASYDSRQWYLYRLPFSDLFLYETGNVLGRIVVASRKAAKKCVVLDCDNTLWGGIIGEDGIEGIAIGEEFPGSAFRDFQKLLLNWRSKGVLLAVASKNDEPDVFEVFEKHSGMVLRKEHISAWQINWRPKAESVQLIAKSLNIGVDSFVFIDDSQMEIEYMRNVYPEVSCVQFPSEPADILLTLQDLAFFDKLEISEEDRKRADMMRAEQDREAFGSQVNHDQFLKALSLRLELFKARPQDLGRISQLINKTNQFNLTTRRRTLDELRALSVSEAHLIYGLRVADKFGEYGLTGAVIIEISPDNRAWIIDTLLLSCRVLGRGVETSLLAALADDARAVGASELIGSYFPTKKNGLAANFLPDHGFSRVDDERWCLSISHAPEIPSYVQRVMEIPSHLELKFVAL
jgi:FkbH-like protein